MYSLLSFAMQHFLRQTAKTGYTAELADPSKKAIVDFYDLLEIPEQNLPGPAEILYRAKQTCEELLKDGTLSVDLRKDISDFSTIGYSMSLPNPSTGHRFIAWFLNLPSAASFDRGKSSYQSAIPPKLSKLFWTCGPILAKNLRQVNCVTQESLRTLYEDYYGVPLDPSECSRSHPTENGDASHSVAIEPPAKKVGWNWRFYAIEITKTYMVGKKLGPELVQKIAAMFVNEPELNHRNDVDAKWRGYVETYFQHLMKQTFDIEFATRVFVDACIEAQEL